MNLLFTLDRMYTISEIVFGSSYSSHCTITEHYINPVFAPNIYSVGLYSKHIQENTGHVYYVLR